MSPTSNALERIARESGRSSLDVLEFYLERASIGEYERGMPRNVAEREALRLTEEWAA